MLQQFGHYLLDEEIARGGMARVYRARLRGPGGFEKPLVVKQILPELARDPRFVAMFVEEAKTLVQMSHPHVVPVYELGVIDDVYFLAMEHVDGATLTEVLGDGPLSPALVAHVGVQVAEALDYAHRRFGLVHRDVTPRNVMIDGGGHVRLLDFGIAAPAKGAEEVGRVFGSPGYMSPEQAGGHALDAKSDLFSLGVVLHEASTGERTFPRQSAAPAQGDPALASAPRLADRTDIPAAIGSLIDELLAPDPTDRPASASEVARQLRGFLAAHRPEGVGTELGRRVERARTARERVQGDSPDEPAPASGSDGRVETLATNPALAAALEETGEATAPIPGRQPAATTPSRKQTRWIVGVAFGLLLAGSAVAVGRWPDGPAGPGPPPSSSSSSEAASEPTEPSPPEPQAPPPPDARPEPVAAGDAGRGRTRPSTETDSERTAAAALTVNATPWAHLRLDGRPLGTTPQRNVRIDAGQHVLVLECPPLGRHTRVSLQAREDQLVRVLADLTTDPPSITIH